MSNNFKIICELCSPLCKEPPQLDSLLYSELIYKQGLCKNEEKLSKGDPIDKIKKIRIPLTSILFNNVPIYFCSDPIYKIEYEFRKDYTYHINPELSFLLSNQERRSILTASGIYKNRRLPIRLYIIDKIVWFCNGTKNSVLNILKNITSIGTLRKQGFGRISKWHVEDIKDDYSFFVKKENKRVLMKTLPKELLQEDMIGYSIKYGSFSPPYWHPGRFTNIIYPI